MAAKDVHTEYLQGLTEAEVILRRQRFGRNVYKRRGPTRFLRSLRGIVTEPMLILLVIAGLIYFILGQSSEGVMMLVAIILVTAISIFQEGRSTHALKALAQFTEPGVKVIRDGMEKPVNIEELVPGDIVLLEEGNKIPADALVLGANDLTINESILTGESFPADKNINNGKDILYQGTTVNSGKCIARITSIGDNTALARLGKSVSAPYTPAKTLLQQQVLKFVRKLAVFGFIGFIIILGVNYFRTTSFTQSLFFGLTLAMAVIPEEIPVAFSSFMALGAFHMSKLGIISRQPQTLENVGRITVICLDKTGTITENRMEVKMIYDHAGDALIDLEQAERLNDDRVLLYSLLASETNPFDTMEKAIIEAFGKHAGNHDIAGMKMIHEYPLQGHPPMMTHVYQHGNRQIVAAKGAVERIISVCNLDKASKEKISRHTRSMANKGFRVLGVASAVHTGGGFPASQNQFNWEFEGLISFYDPPKKNIPVVFRQFYNAGITIKLLTGDYPETAINIAQQVGMTGYLKYYTGEQVMQMKDDELKIAVQSVNMFARMFPDAKLKVIEALKAAGEIVAMTGDGVNDGPALKASDIGIAMGKKGTEIARQASDLVVTDDDLQNVVEAIKQGRKIQNNLKKAVRYIVSIHIPIILTAALPVILGWKYPNIFTPIHIIFLELIMGPTCSIFFEREPVEKNIMDVRPQSRRPDLFGENELLISVVQGLIMAAGVLSLYYIFMNAAHSIGETRMVVFTALLISNTLLTFVNRSFSEGIGKTIFYRNNLAPWVLLVSITFLIALHLVPPIRDLFLLSPIDTGEFLLCTAVALVSVGWFEVYKGGLKFIYGPAHTGSA